jgi:hypothetical protein
MSTVRDWMEVRDGVNTKGEVKLWNRVGNRCEKRAREKWEYFEGLKTSRPSKRPQQNFQVWILFGGYCLGVFMVLGLNPGPPAWQASLYTELHTQSKYDYFCGNNRKLELRSWQTWVQISAQAFNSHVTLGTLASYAMSWVWILLSSRWK